MSTDEWFTDEWFAEERSRRILRFAFGITLAAALGYGLQTPLAVLSTVLVAASLGTTAPRPTPKMLLAGLLCIAGAVGLGVLVGSVALTTPAVYYLAMALLLYRIFYATAGGAPAFPMLMLLLGVVLIPLLGSYSMSAAVDFARDFVAAAAIALLLIWLMFWLLPDTETAVASEAAAAPPATRAQRHRYALERSAAVLPLLVLVVSFHKTDQMTTLMYAAILIQAPAAAAGRQAGLGMLAGSLIGGAFAIVFYLLTTLWFSYALLIMLVLLFGLIMGTRIFSQGPWAAWFAKSPAAMLILINSSNEAYGDETQTKLLLRIAAVVMASLYVLVAFDLMERVRARGSAKRGGEPV
ncbi:MAG: DUF2955 domain-containing protein [Deltaproteobacteria bacterium]|nr:DUF2955 domain-containing protein [Deltaproteobacteria bacterium]MBW2421183.1 DUF2955 domain-containing protein [Deltaproteobacteria bacterium]